MTKACIMIYIINIICLLTSYDFFIILHFENNLWAVSETMWRFKEQVKFYIFDNHSENINSKLKCLDY